MKRYTRHLVTAVLFAALYLGYRTSALALGK
ncbi:unnamed protein product, partial [marine sediment metagenome]